jgi:hypothetical protein
MIVNGLFGAVKRSTPTHLRQLSHLGAAARAEIVRRAADESAFLRTPPESRAAHPSRPGRGRVARCRRPRARQHAISIEIFLRDLYPARLHVSRRGDRPRRRARVVRACVGCPNGVIRRCTGKVWHIARGSDRRKVEGARWGMGGRESPDDVVATIQETPMPRDAREVASIGRFDHRGSRVFGGASTDGRRWASEAWVRGSATGPSACEVLVTPTVGRGRPQDDIYGDEGKGVEKQRGKGVGPLTVDARPVSY